MNRWTAVVGGMDVGWKAHGQEDGIGNDERLGGMIDGMKMNECRPYYLWREETLDLLF